MKPVLNAAGFGKSRGFTLVEVLVCVAIVLVLAGILMSAIPAATARTRALRCGQSLRQMGIGLVTYLADHRAYPEGYAERWMGLAPGVHSPQLAACPELPNYSYAVNVRGVSPLSMGWNHLGLGPRAGRRPTREQEVVAPSQMIAMSHAVQSFAPPNVALELSKARVHGGAVSFLTCDGGVETLRDGPNAARAVANRWNSDNQPHFEFW
jgi:prepilin-type N-terminal cleavage/methylation domain-containing protein